MYPNNYGYPSPPQMLPKAPYGYGNPMVSFDLYILYKEIRGVLRTLSNIEDGAFCDLDLDLDNVLLDSEYASRSWKIINFSSVKTISFVIETFLVSQLKYLYTTFLISVTAFQKFLFILRMS